MSRITNSISYYLVDESHSKNVFLDQIKVRRNDNFRIVTHRSDIAVEASPNGPSQAIDCLVAGDLRCIRSTMSISNLNCISSDRETYKCHEDMNL